MTGVRDHRELDAWKLADELRQRVTEVIERPAFYRERRLRDQIASSAETPCPNIAEGFSRYYPRDFARFLRIAKASLTEFLDHLGRALSKRLVDAAEFEELSQIAKRARGACTALIRYLESAHPPSQKRG
jgi:four helix bundle protein